MKKINNIQDLKDLIFEERIDAVESWAGEGGICANFDEEELEKQGFTDKEMEAIHEIPNNGNTKDEIIEYLIEAFKANVFIDEDEWEDSMINFYKFVANKELIKLFEGTGKTPEVEFYN